MGHGGFGVDQGGMGMQYGGMGMNQEYVGMDSGAMGMSRGAMGMQRGRGAVARGCPVNRPFRAQGTRGAYVGVGGGPPAKMMRMDEPGLFFCNISILCQLCSLGFKFCSFILIC